MSKPKVVISGRWEIPVPGWRPVSTNKLFRSVRARIRLKKSDRQIVCGYTLLAGVPRATGKRRVSLKIMLGPRDRKVDPDNLTKSLFDALKHAGAIVDDKEEDCEWGGVVYVPRCKALSTTIVVEDIAYPGG